MSNPLRPLPDGLPPTVVLCGTPGAGTSTVAEALARWVAGTGRKTALLSDSRAPGGVNQPAAGHPEPDIKPDMKSGAKPALELGSETTLETGIELEPGCYKLAFEHHHRLDLLWAAGLGEALTRLADLVSTPTPDRADLLDLSAVTDLVGLLRLRSVLTESRWDAVIVDLGPRTMATLALPERAIALLERYLPVQNRLDRAVRAGAAGRPDPLLHWLPRVLTELRSLQSLLTGPQLRHLLVTTPDPVALDRGADLIAAHGLFGRGVCGVLVNRMIPTGDDPWRRALAAEQHAGLSRLPVETPRWLLPLLPQAELADLVPLVPDATTLDVVEAEAVQRTDEGYQLTLLLPGVRRSELDLRRRGDTLLLRLPHTHRAMLLPSALRRCVVTSAQLREGRLRVHFEPDPNLWSEHAW